MYEWFNEQMDRKKKETKFFVSIRFLSTYRAISDHLQAINQISYLKEEWKLFKKKYNKTICSHKTEKLADFVSEYTKQKWRERKNHTSYSVHPTHIYLYQCKHMCSALIFRSIFKINMKMVSCEFYFF